MDKLNDESKVIISDRSFISSLAYQEHADWINILNKFAKKPDLLLLLDLDVEKAVSRTSGDDTFENEEFLTKVKDNYLNIIDNPDNYDINNYKDYFTNDNYIKINNLINEYKKRTY